VIIIGQVLMLMVVMRKLGILDLVTVLVGLGIMEVTEQ